VFAAANTALPEQLYREGRVEKPVDFTANRLVLAVPAGSHVTALADLAGPGMKVAVGSPSVPIGEYTRQVLARVAARQRERILANVKTEEPEVTGIVGKLTQGAVDAGFVYATDVQATRGAVRAIRLPDRLQPSVRYAAAVVRGSAHRTVARRFVAGLVDGAGKRALRAAGFEPVR
jgi:molybdate transport system substrate-binding protein